MDLFFQSLGEANKEEKGNAKKKAKVEKKDWTRRGDEVLLKRGLVVPRTRSRKMWKTTFRLKQLKRMGLLRGSVGMKKTGTGRCCGSRQGTSSDSFRRGLGNLTFVFKSQKLEDAPAELLLFHTFIFSHYHALHNFALFYSMLFEPFCQDEVWEQICRGESGGVGRTCC